MVLSYLPVKKILWLLVFAGLGVFFLQRIHSHGDPATNQQLVAAGNVINNREIHSNVEQVPVVETKADHVIKEVVNPAPPKEAVKPAAPAAVPTPIPQPDDKNALPNFYIHDGVVSLYQQSVPAFIHVPRSGGVTMETCLNKTSLYFANKTPKRLDRDGRRDLKTLFKNAKITSKAYRLYAGNYAMGICEDIPDRNCGYVLILRNPYDRLVSAYFACREGVGDSGYPLDCHSAEVQDWAIAVSSAATNYLFTHFDCTPIIDKDHWFIPRYECDYHPIGMNKYEVVSANEELLQYTLDRMDKSFIMIGLTEEYVMTLQLLQNAFNFPFYEECKDLHENKGTFTDSGAREQAKQKLMSNTQVQQALSADIRLYDKAKEIFELQKQKLAAMFS